MGGKIFLISWREKIDEIEHIARKKEITLPIDIIGAVLFIILALVLMVITPKQVVITGRDFISGRMFPTMLMVLMLSCCFLLLARNIRKILKKEPIQTCTLNLMTELKAMMIFLILLGTYVVCRVTDLFVAGAVFCCLGFLFYYRCKKKSYYVITIALAIVIWSAFRFGLGIRF